MTPVRGTDYRQIDDSEEERQALSLPWLIIVAVVVFMLYGFAYLGRRYDAEQDRLARERAARWNARPRVICCGTPVVSSETGIPR